MRREKAQFSKIRNEKREITTPIKEIQKIIKDYNENLYSSKLENLEEMNKILDTYDHLTQEDINHLNRLIIHNEIEAAIDSPQTKKSRN
jgi:hypothetical protein